MPLHCNFNIRIEVGHCNLEGSSRSHMFFKIGVLKNFPNFTGKQLCWSLFLTKFFTNFIKNTPTQVFSCEICKTFKNTFFDRTPPVAASVKRDSNAGFYLWNLLNFWLYFLAEQLRWLLLNGHFPLERSRNACYIDTFDFTTFFPETVEERKHHLFGFDCNLILSFKTILLLTNHNYTEHLQRNFSKRTSAVFT